MEDARKRLANPNLRISEIAYDAVSSHSPNSTGRSAESSESRPANIGTNSQIAPFWPPKIRNMKTINETFLVTAFALLWLVVLPVAGLIELGVVVSYKIEAFTARQARMALGT